MAKIEKIPLKLAGRLSFPQLEKPRPYGAPDKSGKVKETYQATVLIDPTSEEGKKLIAAIKAEAVRVATAKFGDNVEMKKLKLAFGLGDKKALGEDGEENKTYAAYKGMFYLSAASERRPFVFNRAAELIEPGNAQYPYAGGYVNLKVELYPWFHPESNKRGVSAELRSIQFVKDGESFGRAPIDPDEEFEALGDEKAEAAPAVKVDTGDNW